MSDWIDGFVKKAEKMVYILGDLNINGSKDDEYQRTIGDNPIYHDPREDKKEETCTNSLVNWVLGKAAYPEDELSEAVDYALIRGARDGFKFLTSLVPTYSLKDPYNAISDHQGLVLEIEQE